MYDEVIKRLREDMPSALADCDFDFVEGWAKEAADAIEELSKRVPPGPHGRLIDADALYEVVKKRTRNWNGGWSDVECVLTGNDIKKAPTIIPASEEGE